MVKANKLCCIYKSDFGKKQIFIKETTIF